MNQNIDIAAALGKPLWRTDSFIPRYRVGEVGSWRINPGGQLVNDWGYFTGPCLLEMLPSLSRRVISDNAREGDRFEVWMSLTPHEIESQELGFRHAHGNMVIMGLGMGWIAANAALNPDVSTVTVVERDPEVINLIYESDAFESLPENIQPKISIVNADALEWRPAPGQTIDFLYADIWLHLAEPGTLGQVKRMQDNVQADEIYFWGQEIAIHWATTHISADQGTISAGLIQRAVANVIALPLLIPDDRDYAKIIQQVIENRIRRRLPIEVDIG